MTFEEAYEYGQKLIFTQQVPNPAADYNVACLKALKMQIPQKVELSSEYPNYNPSECPNCECELSTFVGDGIYEHPRDLKMCPECRQQIYYESGDTSVSQ